MRIPFPPCGEGAVGPAPAIQVALGYQVADEALLVLGRERQVELLLIDRLDDELVRVADHVGLDLAQPHAFVGEGPGRASLVEEVRALGFVDEQFDRNVQLPAVVQHAGVRERDAPRAHVHVETVVERADLTLAANLGVLSAATDGPGQAANAVARLEDAVVVAQLAQLVTEHETGHPGAENQHLVPLGPTRERRTRPGLPGHQVERRHGGHDERRAPHEAQPFEENAARDHHFRRGPRSSPSA